MQLAFIKPGNLAVILDVTAPATRMRRLFKNNLFQAIT